ncbi:MAG: FecR domain-containing protein [Saprospiraceae bacterium]
MTPENLRFSMLICLFSFLLTFCGEKEQELISPSGGYQHIEYKNGTIVKLGPQSKAYYHLSSNEINLTGEAILEVAPDKELNVTTPNGIVNAQSGNYRIHSRRTSLNVFVLNGKAISTNIDGTAKKELTDGMFAIYNGKNLAHFDKKKVEQMTNDKYWVFTSASILFILESLTAQYGVTFDKADANINKVFSGFIPRDDLQIALSILTRSIGLEYVQEGSNYIFSDATY